MIHGIVAGQASQYTPPPPPGDPYWSQVALLLKMEGANGSTTFVDSSQSPKTMTVFGNVAITNADQRFGVGSATFDGSGDYLRAPGDFWPTGSTSFTVESFFKVPSLPSSGGLYMIFNIENPETPNYGVVNVEITPSGQVGLFVFPSGDYVSGGNVSPGYWHHVAICRNVNTWILFLDGIKIGSDITNSISFGPVNFNIGMQPVLPSRAFNGLIDEVRVTVGVARYTGNFTVPTDEFPTS
jgi:hypothetical protein